MLNTVSMITDNNKMYIKIYFLNVLLYTGVAKDFNI